MKKYIGIIWFILLSNTISGEISITSSKQNPYVNEIIEITVKVPKEKSTAPVELVFKNTSYEIIENRIVEYSYYNNETELRADYLEYTFRVLISEPGTAIISSKIDNKTSKEIRLNAIDPHIDQPLPVLKKNLNSKTIYVREMTHITNSLFFYDEIKSLDHSDPAISINTNVLETPPPATIMVDDKEAQYRVSAYTFDSDQPGDFIIPESEVQLNNKTVKFPRYNIKVMSLPQGVTNKTIIGKSLNIEVMDLVDSYHIGDNIDFNIKVSGDVNLSDLTSLKQYFNFPNSLTERVELRKNTLYDHQMINTVIFSYSGTVTSLVGIKINKVEIPLFNTETGAVELAVLNKVSRPGTISIWLLSIYILILILSCIVTAKLLVKLVRSKKRKSEFISYKFNREKEVIASFINDEDYEQLSLMEM